MIVDDGWVRREVGGLIGHRRGMVGVVGVGRMVMVDDGGGERPGGALIGETRWLGWWIAVVMLARY